MATRIHTILWIECSVQRFLKISLFSFFVLVATCPLWGQVNFGVEGFLENDRLIIKLDDDILDTPMLFIRHGDGQLQVEWSKQGNFIELNVPAVKSRAGVTIPQYHNPSIANHILGRFPIQGMGGNGGPYTIDVTELFLSTPISWGINAEEIVFLDQSGIVGLRHLDNELAVDTKRTVAYLGKRKTLEVTFSFFLLPEPMKPRLFDHRMGYHYEDLTSPLRGEPWTEKGSIMRWRLQKRDMDRPLSDPLKPIVFYLGPKIPDQWKPYIKAGVMEWLPAFEKAGFQNAIEVREITGDNLDIAQRSVNHSIVRWKVKQDVRGHEMGGSTVFRITDLRSGEILKADILLGSDVYTLSDEYFVRCAPLDKRAQNYPFSEELVGALIQSMTAHEVGHAFGIKDGNFGEYAYPFERIRDYGWLQKMGHTPSIMNYSRHNHIAQPGDSIPGNLLIQRVGPMDLYQIQWGYMSIPTAQSPEEEFAVLDTLVRKQDTLPWLRSNASLYEVLGPGCTDEVADNDNPLMSTLLGLRNLERVMELIPRVNQGKKDHELMKRLYGKTLDFWYEQMDRMLSMVGGYDVRNISGGQEGSKYIPLSWDDQQRALFFLLDNAFEVPQWLSNPNLQVQISYSTNADYLLNRQLKLLDRLIDVLRLKRLEFMEENFFEGQVLPSLFEVMGKSLFKELEKHEPLVIRRRQSIQQAYLSLLVKYVKKENFYGQQGLDLNHSTFSEYSKNVMTFELLEIQKMVKKALKRTKDKSTLGHLQRCLTELKKMAWEK